MPSGSGFGNFFLNGITIPSSFISSSILEDIQAGKLKLPKELEIKGVKSTPEEVKEEGIVIPFRKKFTKPEPEGKAQGGIIGYALGGRTGYAEGTPMAGLVDQKSVV